MISKEFFEALDELTQKNNIDKEVIISTLETALTAAYKKHFNEGSNAMVKYDPEKKTLKIIKYKNVVEEVADAEKEISLVDAKKIKKTYKVGDRVEEVVVPKEFGRIAIQSAKQVVMQKVRELEKATTVEKINSLVGTFMRTTISRVDGDNVYVKLDDDILEGQLSKFDQVPEEHYNQGDSIAVYVKKVKDNPKVGPIAQVTRAGTEIIRCYFEEQVPEIRNGEIIIKSIAREAGKRTKIAIETTNPEFDPIGACIGQNSVRINNILSELGKEKIDIVLYDSNPYMFIENALSPAKPTDIEENDGEYTVYIPNDKLSIAFGKGGINIKLAAKLTGCKITLKGTDDYSDSLDESEEQTINVDEQYDTTDTTDYDEDYSLDDADDISDLFSEEE